MTEVLLLAGALVCTFVLGYHAGSLRARAKVAKEVAQLLGALQGPE